MHQHLFTFRGEVVSIPNHESLGLSSNPALGIRQLAHSAIFPFRRVYKYVPGDT